MFIYNGCQMYAIAYIAVYTVILFDEQ